jgi:hypothetical protein
MQGHLHHILKVCKNLSKLNKMQKLKFRITATVVKNITVEVDDIGLSEDQVEEIGREQAHQEFSVLCDGTEEKYNESSELITE